MDSSCIFFTLRIAIISTALQTTLGQNKSDMGIVFDKLMKSYDKNSYPYSDKPTEDKLGLYVNSFSINDFDMTFEMLFYLRQSWKDPRLNFEESTVDSWDDIPESTKRSLAKQRKIRLSPEKIKRLFVPDLFLRNSLSVDKFLYDKISNDNTLTTINKTGHVWHVRKLTSTLTCPMKFQKFPFDTQSCGISFESFGATMDNLFFSWLDNPVDIDPIIQVPLYTLGEIILFDCSQNYTAGAFPCLEIKFLLHRDSGYYIFQGFIPSVLAVVMSWFMFWTNMKPGLKVILGVILMVLLMFLEDCVTQELPSVSYIKCSDVWFGFCIAMVFLATIISVRISNTGDDKRYGGKFCSCTLERLARLVFPIIFIIFIVIFAILYTV